MAFFRFVRQLRTPLTTRLRLLPYRFSVPLTESGRACAADPTALLNTTRVTEPPARQRFSRELWIVLCALLFVCAIYLLTSGIPKLFDQVDGQYAGAAREMIARGDWLVPTQDGIPRPQKPPLLYWLKILSQDLWRQRIRGQTTSYTRNSWLVLCHGLDRFSNHASLPCRLGQCLDPGGFDGHVFLPAPYHDGVARGVFHGDDDVVPHLGAPI